MKFGTQKHFRKPVPTHCGTSRSGTEHRRAPRNGRAIQRGDLAPRAAPLVLQLAKGKVAWLHDVLAKLAVLTQREENAIAVANPAWQAASSIYF